MRILFVPIVIALVAYTANSAAGAEHITDSLATVQKAVADGSAVLIDVRERREWDAGHLRDAGLVPLSFLQSQNDGSALANFLPARKIIYCHCASGRRVLEAAKVLRRFGYDVRPLRAGYAELLRAGFPKAD